MLTVALVEDNPDNRLVVRLLLAERYRVCDYATGEAALAAFASEPPDLVLTDIDMPGMDGLAVLARVRAMPGMAGVPVVAITAHAMRGERERLLAAGFDEYVSKPVVDDAALFALIDGCVAARRGARPTSTPCGAA